MTTVPRREASWLRTLALPALLILVSGAVYWYRVHPRRPKLDAFAQCLASKPVKMYGLYWCEHCAEQKQLFGNSFKYIPYIECGIRGSRAETPECIQAGAKLFPMWQFPDGQKLEGKTSLQVLSQKTGCALP